MWLFLRLLLLFYFEFEEEDEVDRNVVLYFVYEDKKKKKVVGLFVDEDIRIEKIEMDKESVSEIRKVNVMSNLKDRIKLIYFVKL